MFAYTFCCALFICCTQVISLEISDDLFDEHTLECMKKTNVDKAFIRKSLNENYYVVKGDAKMNEYLECLGKLKNVVEEDGKLNRPQIHGNVINLLFPLLNKSGDKYELANKVTDECMNVEGDSYGDRMANIHNCLVDALAKQ